MKLPSPVIRYVCDHAVKTRRGAFLSVDDKGHLLESGGSLALYGLSDLKAGVPVADHVDFLQGMLPLEGNAELLLAIEVAPGTYAEAHFLPADGADWVILFDSSEETAIDQLLQQRTYESSLLREQLDRERQSKQEAKRVKGSLRDEREKARHFLGSILPDAIIERLNRGEKSIADEFEDAAFLHIAVAEPENLLAGLPVAARAQLLGEIFAVVDRLVKKELGGTVKTAGLACLVGFGVPVSLEGPLIRAARAANDIACRFRAVTAGTNEAPVALQMALSVGPAMGAIVGFDRFAYEVWGQPVGEVSQLVRQSGPGEILVTDAVAQRLAGRVDIKKSSCGLPCLVVKPST